MRARFFNKMSKGHLAWLLGILLLMPLAQTAAAWHLISHAQSQASEKRGPQSTTTVSDFCELCQVAAATTGGLLPTLVTVSAAAAAPCGVPQFTCQTAATPPLRLPYAIRAPPFALI